MTELATVHEIAEGILAQDPDPVVRFLLLRDVLRLRPDGTEVTEAQQAVLTSHWVQELEREQWSDGSWGRFHSQDSGTRQKIPTTEVGVQRALTVGLDAGHPVLRKASRYVTGILSGTIQFPDSPEKNDRWPTGRRLFCAATLAQIQPGHPILDGIWTLWATIAQRTFASGAYDPEAEIGAHRELTGASVKDSYLVLNNKDSLTLLGSRADALPRDVETALLSWVWHKEDGVRYLGEKLDIPPRHPEPGPLDRWLTSLELLARFPSWRGLAKRAMQWLWDQRTGEGFWDLGPRAANSVAFPLSNSWRSRASRRFDWSSRVLVLLRRGYVDSG
jgi:hypothetical protein